MTQVSDQLHVASALMYLYSRHVVCCNAKKEKVCRHDKGDYNAIRVLESLYTILQLI